jgi:small-conductance mechanosensitive channel
MQTQYDKVKMLKRCGLLFYAMVILIFPFELGVPFADFNVKITMYGSTFEPATILFMGMVCVIELVLGITLLHIYDWDKIHDWTSKNSYEKIIWDVLCVVNICAIVSHLIGWYVLYDFIKPMSLLSCMLGASVLLSCMFVTSATIKFSSLAYGWSSVLFPLIEHIKSD